MSQSTSPCSWCRWLPVFVIGLLVGAAVLTFAVNRISTSKLPLAASVHPEAEWVEYQDKMAGIRFRYPPGWSVASTPNYLNVLDENRQLIISVEPNLATAELNTSVCSNFVTVPCEIANYNSLVFEINWGEDGGGLPTAFTRQDEMKGVRFTLLVPSVENNAIFRKFLTMFTFL